jgi:AraC-like DNA-binding protein
MQPLMERNYRDNSKVAIPQVIRTERTGRLGRPRKQIDRDFLRIATAANRHINMSELAECIGVHRNTLASHLKEEGLRPSYSTITDEHLEDIVRAFKIQRPESGYRYLVGHLRNQGLRIQRRRVIKALRHVDGLGRRLRVRKALRRRKYHVRHPNAMWHLDGHHKMIRWGIVIHGMIDGYCRTV